MDTLLPIYHADGLTGEYIGTGFAERDPRVEGNWLIPASAYTDKPPETEKGYVAIYNGEAWSAIRDYRGEIYSTHDGSPQQYNSLGDLPPGFTDKPRPNIYYVWLDNKWTLDKSAKIASEQSAERQWRDAEIESIKWLRERHRDESDIGLANTLNDEQFKELLTYLQQLRDWPQSSEFPAVASRPVPPEWVASQTQ